MTTSLSLLSQTYGVVQMQSLPYIKGKKKKKANVEKIAPNGGKWPALVEPTSKKQQQHQ